METQRNADDGISAESVNEKAKHYFIVNDQFRQSLQPKENLPEGIERSLNFMRLPMSIMMS